MKKIVKTKIVTRIPTIEKRLVKIVKIPPTKEELESIIAPLIPEPIKGDKGDSIRGLPGEPGKPGKSFTKKQVKEMIDESIAEKKPELMASLQGTGELRVEDAKDGYNIVISGKKYFVPNAVYGPKLRNFIQLGDTPGTYIGGAGKFIKVNSTETGLEYAAGDGTGTVTSVGATSTGGTLIATGGPITTSGTLNYELNLSNANTWTGTQSFNATIPAHFASASNWTTDDFNVARIATDNGGPDTYLSLDWSPTYAGGVGALRFADTGGNLKFLNANIYGDNAQFNNQLIAGAMYGNMYPSGGTQNYIYYGGASGLITGDAKFTFNATTNRLLVSNAGITAQSQGHFHQSGATAVDLRFTNSATGSGSGDGSSIGISTTGVLEINQRESNSVTVTIAGTVRTTWSSGGASQLSHIGEFIIARSSLTTTNTYGLRIENQTSATLPSPIQQPAMFQQLGHVWDTGASATRVLGFNMAQTFTSGNPGSSVLKWGYQYNSSGSFSATGFTYLMNLSSTGRLHIGSATTVGSANLHVTSSSEEIARFQRSSGNNAAIGFANSSSSVFVGATSAGNVFGVASTADITVDSTLYVNVNLDRVGINTSAPDTTCEINLGTSGAFRLTYNDANGGATTYSDTSISSTGGVTFNAVGSDPKFIFSDPVELSNLRAAGSGGILFESNSGTDIALMGAGGGSGVTFYGTVIHDAPVRLKNYTVATLPSGTQGDTAYVTDALAPTYLTIIVGGGTVVTPVFYNGTNWVAI